MQYGRTLWVTGAIFILAQLALAYAVLRFRDRGRPARFIRGNNALEIVWTVATVALFIGLSLLGRRAWADARFGGAPADAVQKKVTTTQFVYTFLLSLGRTGVPWQARSEPGKRGRRGIRWASIRTMPGGKQVDIVVPVLTVPGEPSRGAADPVARHGAQFLRARAALAARRGAGDGDTHAFHGGTDRLLRNCVHIALRTRP